MAGDRGLIAVGLLVAVAADFAWVAARARREWRRSEELSVATAVGIGSLYVLFAAQLAVALLLRPWPLGLPLPVVIAAGGALLVGGLALAAAGARLFGSSARLFGVERGGLIEGGVYRFSRNPQYAGLVIAVTGIAVMGRSGVALALAALFCAGVWLWVVRVEEPHLLTTFGSRYVTYREQVPRFVGLPRDG